jgi:hypothetical protein
MTRITAIALIVLGVACGRSSADLNLSDDVEVKGGLQANGTLLARSVHVDDAQEAADAGTDDA